MNLNQKNEENCNLKTIKIGTLDTFSDKLKIANICKLKQFMQIKC